MAHYKTDCGRNMCAIHYINKPFLCRGMCLFVCMSVISEYMWKMNMENLFWLFCCIFSQFLYISFSFLLALSRFSWLLITIGRFQFCGRHVHNFYYQIYFHTDRYVAIQCDWCSREKNFDWKKVKSLKISRRAIKKNQIKVQQNVTWNFQFCRILQNYFKMSAMKFS